MHKKKTDQNRGGGCAFWINSWKFSAFSVGVHAYLPTYLSNGLPICMYIDRYSCRYIDRPTDIHTYICCGTSFDRSILFNIMCIIGQAYRKPIRSSDQPTQQHAVRPSCRTFADPIAAAYLQTLNNPTNPQKSQKSGDPVRNILLTIWISIDWSNNW